MREYGWNNGFDVFCGFCAWTQHCTSMENIEHRLKTHLKTVHGKDVLFRREDETGKINHIPASHG